MMRINNSQDDDQIIEPADSSKLVKALFVAAGLLVGFWGLLIGSVFLAIWCFE